MADNRVNIIIDAHDQASAKVKGVGDSLKSLDTVASAVMGNFVVRYAQQIGQFVYELGEMGLQAKRSETALKGLAGGAEEATDMVAAIQRASGGAIDKLSAMEVANRSLMLGVVNNAEQMENFTAVAVRLGQAMGRGPIDAINDLSMGIGRQSRMILDNLGLVVSVEKANDSYAASVGKTADELTDAERKLAFFNAAMDDAAKVIAKMGGSSADGMLAVERMTAAIADLKLEAGNKAAPALEKLAIAVTYLINSGKDLDTAVYGNIKGLVLESDTVDEVIEKLKGNAAAWNYLTLQGKAGTDWMGNTFVTMKDTSGATVVLTQDLLELTHVMDKTKGVTAAGRQDSEAYAVSLHERARAALDAANAGETDAAALAKEKKAMESARDAAVSYTDARLGQAQAFTETNTRGEEVLDLQEELVKLDKEIAKNGPAHEALLKRRVISEKELAKEEGALLYLGQAIGTAQQQSGESTEQYAQRLEDLNGEYEEYRVKIGEAKGEIGAYIGIVGGATEAQEKEREAIQGKIDALEDAAQKQLAVQAIEGLTVEMFGGNVEAYTQAKEQAMLATGLITEQGLAETRAIQLLGAAYAENVIGAEVFSDALRRTEDAAADGVVSLGELTAGLGKVKTAGKDMSKIGEDVEVLGSLESLKTSLIPDEETIGLAATRYGELATKYGEAITPLDDLVTKTGDASTQIETMGRVAMETKPKLADLDTNVRLLTEHTGVLASWTRDYGEALRAIPKRVETQVVLVTPGAGGEATAPSGPAGGEPRAEGGTVLAGRPYLVGEQGAEWFVPGSTGSVVPGGVAKQNVIELNIGNVIGRAQFTGEAAVDQRALEGMAVTMVDELNRQIQARLAVTG